MARAWAGVGLIMGLVVIAGFFLPWLTSEEIPEDREVTGNWLASLPKNENLPTNEFESDIGKMLFRAPYLALLGGILLISSSIFGFTKHRGVTLILLICGAIALFIGILFPAGFMLIVVNLAAEKHSMGIGIGFHMEIFGFIFGAISVYLSGEKKEETSEDYSESVLKCPECGAELEPDSVYCVECGAEITSNENSP